MPRYFTGEHEWIEVDGETGTVGISDYAQGQLGDIVFVDVPEEGKELSKGDEAAVVESVKAASDIYAPVSGEIVAFNEELEGTPNLINEAAFNTWIYKIKPDNAADVDQLLDAAGYEAVANS